MVDGPPEGDGVVDEFTEGEGVPVVHPTTANARAVSKARPRVTTVGSVPPRAGRSPQPRRH